MVRFSTWGGGGGWLFAELHKYRERQRDREKDRKKSDGETKTFLRAGEQERMPRDVPSFRPRGHQEFSKLSLPISVQYYSRATMDKRVIGPITTEIYERILFVPCNQRSKYPRRRQKLHVVFEHLSRSLM
jgi:hypothetical protein